MLTATDHIQLDGSTPFAKVHGYTPNIAEYVQFKWFEWVWYHDPNDPNKQMLGRWCGPAHNIGQGMAYHILSSKGKMITCSTVAPLTQDKIKLPQNMERMESFTKEMELIIENFSKSTSNRVDLEVNKDPYDFLFEDDNLPSEDDLIQNPIANESDPPYMEDNNEMVNTRIQIQRDGVIQEGRIAN